MAEEAGKASLLLGGRLDNCLVHRLVIQGNIDLGLGLLRAAPGRLQRHYPHMWLLRLLLVAGPFPVLFNQGAHRQPQSHHQQHHEQHREDNDGSQAREHRRGAHRQSAGDGAAGGQSLAGGPQLRQHAQG